jgi:PadR family transcriptional regulator PadR
MVNIENAKAQMKKGVLELCILSIIGRGEVYASDIIDELKTAKMIVVEGTLYPFLTRLKNDGLVSYQWRESKSGPPRKYFQLTIEGKDYVKGLTDTWQELVLAVSNVTTINK